jgi:multidrug efflux pump subunit AcrB
MIATPGGRSVPLEQIAKLSYGLEPPLIWRRHRLPTVTVQADTASGVQAATVVKSLESNIAAFKAKLPPGYDVAGSTTTVRTGRTSTDAASGLHPARANTRAREMLQERMIEAPGIPAVQC